MAEAPHGTAPSLEGKNVANPMAMILAGAALLTFFHEEEASRVSRAIYEATFETILDGVKTADLGGATGTTEFTDEIIRHVQTKLEVWSALA
jgi:isocitrate/isopropylmalate dehydrogenase